MARSRKKGTADAAPPAQNPPASPPPVVPPPVRLWSADGGRGRRLGLYQDPAGGVLRIAPADPAQPLQLPAAACDLLRQNEFAEEALGGPWARPVDADRVLLDRLDAERVLLKVAELCRGDGPSPSTGRRGRSR